MTFSLIISPSLSSEAERNSAACVTKYPFASEPETRTGNDLDHIFDQYISVIDSSASDFQWDSYVSYCHEPTDQKFHQVIFSPQRNFQEINCPDLTKMAHDMHSIPFISVEYECVCFLVLRFLSLIGELG